MLKDKENISEWKQIENSLKEWLLAIENYKKEYGDEFTDEIESVYDKEWNIISKIKKWLKTNKLEDFENNDLSESELELFNQLLGKAKHIDLDLTNSQPYSMLFFLPVTLWNDDPESKTRNVLLTTHNILPKQRFTLERLIKTYLEEYLYSSLPSENTYSCVTFPILAQSNIKNLYAGSEYENQDIDPFTLIHSENIKRLSDVSKEHWLTGGLLPVLIRSEKYSTIADTDFTHDDVFINNLNTVYNNNRLISGFPTYLEDAVIALENMNWDLWKFEYIDKDIPDEILKKEVLFITQKFGDFPVSLKTCVKDYYKENKVVEFSYEKEVISFDDIQLSMMIQNMDERLLISIQNKNMTEHQLKIKKYKIMKNFLKVTEGLEELNNDPYWLTDEKAPDGTLLN